MKSDKADGVKNASEMDNEQNERRGEFYLEIFDNLPGFIWWFDAEANRTHVNKSFLEFCGKASEENILEVWAESIHPEDRERCFEAYRSAVYERKNYRIKFRIRRHDGIYRWIFETGKPILNSEGRYIGYTGCAYDLTERFIAEDKLKESEQRYRLLFSNMTEAFLYGKVVCNSEGVPVDYIILEANDAFEEMIGFTKAEMQGRRATEINPNIRGSEPDLVEICGQVALTGMRKRFEVKMDYKGRIYMISTYSPHPGHFVNIFTDITEQKRAETEIRKLSSAIEQSHSMALITDSAGIIEYVNQKFTSFTGYGFEEAKGRVINEFSKMPGRQLVKMLEKINKGEVWEGEFLSRKKNGGFNWVSASISPIRDENGAITHYVSMQDDITEKKEMQEKLEKNNKRLQKAVRELKQVQEHLIEQEKLAGIGQLAAGAAHEMNNPLGYVISNFDTLSKYYSRFGELIHAYRHFSSQVGNEEGVIEKNLQKLDELEKKINIDFIINDANDIFNDCNDGLERIKKIVSGLGTFAKSEQRDIPEVYDLNAGIESTLTVINNEIMHRIEVEKELQPVPLIGAVEDQINQVLLNLTVNAVQAINLKDSGKQGLIVIRTYSDSKYAYCEIEDNGIGIPRENMKKIFNPFFTTKPVGQGAGLGLSISYNIIVTRHNGQLTVKSEYGRGTRFTIKLPIGK